MLSRSVVSVAALLLAGAAGSLADTLPSEQDRLLATGKLWSIVQYFHPYLAYRDIDWDKALVAVLPRIRTAGNGDDYAAALNQMLEQLHDGSSSVYPVKPGPMKPGTGERTWIHYGTSSAFLTKPDGIETVAVPMGAGVTATVRLSEPVSASLPPFPKPRPEPAYADMPYPATEYRILAAYKLWSAVRNFFAYRDLMDEDWDQVFGEFLPKFIAATNAREYNLAVAEAVTHLHDTNAQVTSANLDEYFGAVPVGLRLRLVEKKPLITEILDDDAKQAGIQIGDIVSKVDGEDVVARINREIAYLPASTDQSLAAEIIQKVLKGPEASSAALTIQARGGGIKDVVLKRSSRFNDRLAFQRAGELMKFLSRAIGYVDLDRLTSSQVDSVFEKFGGTTAIIFDMRGNLHFNPDLLAARLTNKPDTAGAIVTGPINLTPDMARPHTLTETASFFRVETFPPSDKPHYSGKTILLIDERTVGAAEHLGLLLEAANNTAFVGTQSAGADAAVSNFLLPGGIAVSFSTTDVRHGNSGKLQRLGLQPIETVAPTVQDIRSGRDHVLEKAIDFVTQ